MSKPIVKYNISIEDMKKRIKYVPETGEFFRLSICNPNDKLYKYKKYKNGDIIRKAGTIDANGYIKISIKEAGVPYIKAHRLAWAFQYGYFPDEPIDHINGIRTDNRIENLRIAPNGENSRNMKKPVSNASGVVGVSWCNTKNRWRAIIWVNGKPKTLGYREDKDDAITLRKEAEQKYKYHKNHGRK